MIADMLSNNKLNPVVTELLIEVEKNISTTFFIQYYFSVQRKY